MKHRNPNFELLRLFAIFAISACHLAGVLGKNSANIPSSLDMLSIFDVQFYSLGGKLGVQIFFLITGYFTINQQFKIQKLTRLWRIVVFYALLEFIFLKCFREPLVKIGFAVPHSDGYRLVQVFFPIVTSYFWFMTTYVLLLLISPVVNSILNKFSRIQFLFLLIASTTVYYSITYALTLNNTEVSEIGSHLALLLPYAFTYSIGAYFALFPPTRTKLTAIMFLASGYLCLLAYRFGINLNLPGFRKASGLLTSSDRAFIPLLIAIGLFLLFSTLEIKSNKIGRIVNSLAKYVLEVYLLNKILFWIILYFFAFLRPDAQNQLLRSILLPVFTLMLVLIGLLFGAIRARIANYISPIVNKIFTPATLLFNKS